MSPSHSAALSPTAHGPSLARSPLPARLSPSSRRGTSSPVASRALRAPSRAFEPRRCPRTFRANAPPACIPPKPPTPPGAASATSVTVRIDARVLQRTTAGRSSHRDHLRGRLRGRNAIRRPRRHLRRTRRRAGGGERAAPAERDGRGDQRRRRLRQRRPLRSPPHARLHAVVEDRQHQARDAAISARAHHRQLRGAHRERRQV